jgi:hypothetical protein
LLSVHCDNSDWVKRAKDVLRQTGAQDIGAAGEKSGDFANADKPMPRVRTATGATTTTTGADTSTIADEELYAERPGRKRVEVIERPPDPE